MGIELYAILLLTLGYGRMVFGYDRTTFIVANASMTIYYIVKYGPTLSLATSLIISMSILFLVDGFLDILNAEIDEFSIDTPTVPRTLMVALELIVYEIVYGSMVSYDSLILTSHN